MNYDQVCLVPKYGILETRDNADVSCEFARRRWKLPVVPSNMETAISFELAEWLEENGYFYILHRFYDYPLIVDWVKRNQHRYISISVGTTQKDFELLSELVIKSCRVDCITVDIAHGFSVSTTKIFELMRHLYDESTRPFVIAGNVFGDEASIRFLENLGADAIKVGLAFGKACITYNQTGFASPMFSSGIEAAKQTTLPLIGDGGIRDNGDITKGLVAGYTMLMAGSIFAQCLDSPATLLDNGNKVYYGSASELGKKGKKKYIEGRAVEIPCNNLSYKQKLEEIEQNLRSSVSYGGGRDLSCFNTVDWIEINK